MRPLLLTALGVLLALVVQSALGQAAPAQARLLDPFLIVLVFVALTGGETRGMLTGVAAGWIQDVHFGGAVVGITGLTKLIVGFGVGLAGSRFLLVGTGQRLMVLFAATLFDALLQERLATLFDIAITELSFGGLAERAVVNAVVGTALFTLADRRRGLGAAS